jgi:RNA polymerase sigma-70 factor (ECF subfamily)
MDSASFEKLLMSFETDLYSFCCYLANNLAGDLYQDTVLAAFEMKERIDPTQNPKAFFFSIAVGKWKNAERKNRRRQAKIPQLPLNDFAVNEPKTMLRDGPEEQVQNAFLREVIERALYELDDKFRIPLILYYFGYLELGAIAGICSIPKGTVKSRLHKGRALLRTFLEKEGFDE